MSIDCERCGKSFSMESEFEEHKREVQAHESSYVGVGPEFVNDAFQHIYQALDAMRRKGSRENQDIGYNAGFNVSADILEAAIKDVKEKLGWMVERSTRNDMRD